MFIFIEQIISFQSFSLFFIENLVNFKVFTCIYAVLFTFVHNGASYKSLFVDDFGVSYRSKHMQAIERQLQLHLNRKEDWADNNGFTFSQSKNACVHFCRRRGLHPDPYLVLNNNPIPVKKFLGILLDSKLV